MSRSRRRKKPQAQPIKQTIDQVALNTTFAVQFGQEVTQPDSQIEATTEKDSEQNVHTDWYPFFKGNNNLFPQVVAWTALNSPTNRAILAAKKSYAKGKLAFLDVKGDPIEYSDIPKSDKAFLENPCGESMVDINDLWSDMVSDWVDSGQLIPLVKIARRGGQVATTVKVVDYTKVRKLKGENPMVKVSAYWHEIKNNKTSQYLKGSKDYPIWDGVGNPPKEFVLFKRRKEAGYDRYGVPDYWACAKDCATEYLVDTYNKGQLEDGFFPRSFITFVKTFEGNSDASTWLEDMYAKMNGAHNAGKTRLSVVSDKDAAPIIHEFDSSKDGEFLALEESAKKGIVSAHRWFPSLGGMETAGKLGNNQELLNQYAIALETVIKPDYQEPCLRVLNKILEIAGVSVRCVVENKPPINVNIEVDPEDVLTVNEGREILGMEALSEDYETEGDTHSNKVVGDMLISEAKAMFNTKHRSNGTN